MSDQHTIERLAVALFTDPRVTAYHAPCLCFAPLENRADALAGHDDRPLAHGRYGHCHRRTPASHARAFTSADEPDSTSPRYDASRAIQRHASSTTP